ncbi:MAG TPA: hypothetical protein VLA05_07995, partial [Coriobacteriia bacterium]|nr:hypothetical protein [Coriobacteriia bacterium]
LRFALVGEFGSRLGRVKVAKSLDAGAPEARQRAATFEMRGGVTDQDLCRALLALYRLDDDPEAGSFWITVLQPDRGMSYESLSWEPEAGRLTRHTGRGQGCECMVTTFLDGGQHACAFSLTPDREISTGVDVSALKRYASGAPVEWDDAED